MSTRDRSTQMRLKKQLFFESVSFLDASPHKRAHLSGSLAHQGSYKSRAAASIARARAAAPCGERAPPELATGLGVGAGAAAALLCASAAGPAQQSGAIGVSESTGRAATDQGPDQGAGWPQPAGTLPQRTWGCCCARGEPAVWKDGALGARGALRLAGQPAVLALVALVRLKRRQVARVAACGGRGQGQACAGPCSLASRLPRAAGARRQERGTCAGLRKQSEDGAQPAMGGHLQTWAAWR